MEKIKVALWTVILLFFICFFVTNSQTVVQPGCRGVLETCGYVADTSYANGFVWRVPFVSKVVVFNAREQKYDFKTAVKLSSMQDVQMVGALNYRLNGNNVHKLYMAIGENYEPVLIAPLLDGAISQTIGKSTPEFLISNQEMVSEAINYIVVDQLSQTDLVEVRDLRLFRPQFDDAFEKAIKNKAVATQIAEKAKIETQRVEEEAKQMLLKAEAEGKALKLKSDALRNPLIVQYEVAKALGKWKGSLPSTLLLGQGSVPLVSVK